MRVTLIHNPHAGENEHPSLDEVLAMIEAAGHEVTCQSSKGTNWDQALEDPGDLVAVAGGDGSVGFVAGRLLGRGIPIAVLPLGTANNISRTLGLADTPIAQLIAGWSTARRLEFDSGVVHAPWGETRFIEGFGVGLLARAITELDAKADVAFGPVDTGEGGVKAGLKHLRELVATCPADNLKITLDGRDFSGEFILLEVMNIQHIGPGLHFAPDANPRDGLLDVVLFTPGERDKLGDYLTGRVEGNPQPLEWAVHRCQHLKLRCEESDMHVDDKVWPAHGPTASQCPVLHEVKVDKHALVFLV